MPSGKEYSEAERERAAREKGRSVSHYAGKVAKELALPGKKGRSTPSKRAGRRSAG